MASSSRKRALVADAAPVSASFPAIGEDKSEWIAEHNVILRYGTSLRLMASCSAFLNESEEFNEVDPTGDWDKWSNRVPGAFTLFYAAIIDPLQPDWSGVQAVLRAVLDGWPTPAPPHKTRLVIDYVTTAKACRGRGHASTLVSHVRDACGTHGAHLYVLALEESCPWWMDKGFVLEAGANLTARLNIFPDVHLLRLSTDPVDEGSPEDLALLDEGGEGDEADEADEIDEGDAAVGDEQRSADAAEPPHHADDGDEDLADSELQAAIAMSMAPTAQSSPSASGRVEDTAGTAAGVASGSQGAAGVVRLEELAETDEEERALQAAIELSMQTQPNA